MAGLAALVGVALAVAAGRVVVAEVVERPGNPALATLDDDDVPSRQALAVAVASRHAAQAWAPNASRLQEIGYLRLALAEQSGGLVRARHLARAIAMLSASLNEAPAQPDAWLQLAVALQATGAPWSRVVPAVVASAEVGPGVRGLVMTRVELGLRAWASLTAKQRAVIQRQLEIAWTRDQDRLLDIARQTGRLGTVTAILFETRSQS